MEKIDGIIICKSDDGKDSQSETVVIGDNGDVCADVIDRGELVMKCFGFSEHRDWYAVSKEWKDTLLLLLIKDRFERVYDFRDWLKEKEIPFESGCY